MIFLDSSVIIAYYNKKDQHHKNAINLIKNLSLGKEDIIISEYIFSECVTVLFLRLKNLKKVSSIGNTLKNVPTISINKNLFNYTWELFKNQENTKLSFTDCSILTSMKQEGINKLATFDREFSKIKDIQVFN